MVNSYRWVFIGIPVAYNAVGGYDAIKATLDPKYLSMTM
jgi:SSS family solute:Na+ symporter